ncbi:MAG TPA: molybdopterin molybdotransferase MoeA [Anaerolinea sp.]|nr:molybdopterin molybdotransferase MoeA [Anaerolinea sp.]
MDSLLAVRDAQGKILQVFSPKPLVEIDLEQAFHRILAQPVRASQDLPAFANSSMDGFAVRSQDVTAASPDQPVWLEIIQDIPAGSVPRIANGPQQASRIMTGAPLPDGADAVIPVEEAALHPSGSRVAFHRPVSPGQYIRPIGQDIRRGEQVLPAGKELTPQDIGLIASLGLAKITVFSTPRVAIFSSGDELIQPGQPISPGKIYDANHYVLSGLLRDAGAEVIDLGTARDSLQDITAHLDEAVRSGADLILSSAGVSVGDYDFVRQVINRNGHLDFWRVNMRPGKPVAFGDYRGIPFLGLPGNPVSAFVGCQVFTLPVVRKLRGADPFQREERQATLLEPVESDGRESYLRVHAGYLAGQLSVRLTGHQGSGNLYALSQANALLILPSGVKSLPAGSTASIWLLGNLADEI